MNSKGIQLLLAGATACVSLMCFITSTQGANIVIGGNTIDIGTIIFVSPKTGDTPATAGTALLNTLSELTDNSADNPYLIKIGPGVYDLGVESLQMKEYVDVEGSGENTTVITGHIDGDMIGVVQGASNAEIRFLTVRNTGGGNYAFAIYNASAFVKLTNVTAFASGGLNNVGVYNIYASSPTLTNVTAAALGGTNSYGVYNTVCTPPDDEYGSLRLGRKQF